MSALITRTIRCDRCGRLGPSATFVSDAFERAARLGWHIAGPAKDIDTCPDCTEGQRQ